MERTMRRVAAIAALPLLSIACGADAGDPLEDVGSIEEPAIYGSDGRVEYGSTAAGRERVWADGTAILMDSAGVTCSGSSCTIATASLGLCAGERFAGQPISRDGDCTAFLVGPDRFVTAGHCIGAGACTNRRVVFGFTGSGTSATTTVPSANVYSCIGVVVDSGSPDYAVIRVDRPVYARAPHWVRYVDKVPNNQALTLIGHPSALPLKIDRGGSVKTNTAATTFGANIDAFEGNSGSPVVNTSTGVVEGILVSGNSDYHTVGSCLVADTCPDTGCSGTFETSTRITEVTQYIPLHPAGTHLAVF